MKPVPTVNPFQWCRTCQSLQWVEKTARYSTHEVGYTLTCGHTWAIQD